MCFWKNHQNKHSTKTRTPNRKFSADPPQKTRLWLYFFPGQFWDISWLLAKIPNIWSTKPARISYNYKKMMIYHIQVVLLLGHVRIIRIQRNKLKHMNSNLPATQKQNMNNAQQMPNTCCKLPGDVFPKKLPTWFNQRRCCPKMAFFTNNLFHHAGGTEGRASPNPCFVLHASGLVIERVIPGNYEYHLCIAIYRG